MPSLNGLVEGSETCEGTFWELWEILLLFWRGSSLYFFLFFTDVEVVVSSRSISISLKWAIQVKWVISIVDEIINGWYYMHLYNKSWVAEVSTLDFFFFTLRTTHFSVFGDFLFSVSVSQCCFAFVPKLQLLALSWMCIWVLA
jgi:hypothetical protein